MRAASRHVELGGRRRKESTPLLPVAHQRSPKPDAARGPGAFLRRHALSYFSFKDDIEARIVLNLVVCGNLANVAFVFGRNAAPAIYIARLGAERLARAMFLSGVTIIAFTPRFSAFAKRRRATQVNGCVLRSGAAILGALYGLLAWCGRGARPPLVDEASKEPLAHPRSSAECVAPSGSMPSSASSAACASSCSLRCFSRSKRSSGVGKISEMMGERICSAW